MEMGWAPEAGVTATQQPYREKAMPLEYTEKLDLKINEVALLLSRR